MSLPKVLYSTFASLLMFNDFLYIAGRKADFVMQPILQKMIEDWAPKITPTIGNTNNNVIYYNNDDDDDNGEDDDDNGEDDDDDGEDDVFDFFF